MVITNSKVVGLNCAMWYCNPFKVPGDVINSVSFEAKVQVVEAVCGSPAKHFIGPSSVTSVMSVWYLLVLSLRQGSIVAYQFVVVVTPARVIVWVLAVSRQLGPVSSSVRVRGVGSLDLLHPLSHAAAPVNMANWKVRRVVFISRKVGVFKGNKDT